MAPSPGEMTTRARWYLLVAATRHLLTAFFAVLMPDTFSSTSFDIIKGAADLWVWGVFIAGSGLTCLLGALRRSDWMARWGLTLSGTSTLLVGVGLLVGAIDGGLSAPTGPIIWLAVAIKDFVVCADPLRTPFEPLARQIRTAEDGGSEKGG